MSISEAATAVASVLSNQKYAVVGGAACVLLGSHRNTDDVDLVVPAGKTRDARAKFRDSPSFVVQSGTAHTSYKDVDIEILTPPALFKEPFDESTPTQLVDGVHILPPVLILNAKCGSIPGRATEDKKASDAADIKYLLKYIAVNHIQVVATDVPRANKAFYDWFTGIYGESDLWTKAGYNAQIGSF